MNVSGHGIAVDLPAGWEGRIYRRKLANTYPVLHAGSFALPHGDDDFGAGAIDAMRDGDVFIAMLEYDPALGGSGLFNEPRVPVPIHATDLSPAAFRKRVSGRLAAQRFFTVHHRPFCLYLVIGSAQVVADRGAVRAANKVLRTVSIEPDGSP